MLIKLLKHEIKATERLFIPLYMSLILFAFINRFINPIERISNTVTNFNVHGILGFISFIIYVFLIIGVSVMTLVIMIQRFYKNLLGDEGYLMFTLPVKPWQHIVSKMLIAVLWLLGSFLVTILSVLIISRINSTDIIKGINYAISQLKLAFGHGLYLLPIYALIMIFSNIIMIYTAISFGHLFSRHKVISSFIAYTLIYMIYQIVLLICIVLYSFIIFPSLKLASPNLTPTATHMNSLFMLLSFAALILSICSFAIINYILEKRLNLQ